MGPCLPIIARTVQGCLDVQEQYLTKNDRHYLLLLFVKHLIMRSWFAETAMLLAVTCSPLPFVPLTEQRFHIQPAPVQQGLIADSWNALESSYITASS